MIEDNDEYLMTRRRVSIAVDGFQQEVGFQPSFILLGDKEWEAINRRTGIVINDRLIPCRHFDAVSFIGVGLNRK